MMLDKITEKVLRMIDGEGFKQEGAFNLRENGISICHGDSEHVKIRKKEDRQGIDIYIDKDTNGETVHIPVVVSSSGMTDVVYNDFYIEEGAKVTIIAEAESTIPDATMQDMTEFIRSISERMRPSITKKSIMVKEKEQEPVS